MNSSPVISNSRHPAFAAGRHSQNRPLTPLAVTHDHGDSQLLLKSQNAWWSKLVVKRENGPKKPKQKTLLVAIEKGSLHGGTNGARTHDTLLKRQVL
jgi:hypothetical protein